MQARRADAQATDAVSTETPLRSFLFVPGDSERKQAKALTSGADALILDLEDSVAADQLPVARERVRAFLAGTPRAQAPQLWVRVNAPSSEAIADDLAAVLPARPDGIVLPKVSAPSEALKISRSLEGPVKLIVIATETPKALLTLSEYASADFQDRLLGLTWGMEDLAAALGATAQRGPEGSLTPAFELARSLCLIAAAAAGVQAIDGIHADFRDTQGLAKEAARARRDGFTGKLAIHPDQIAAINAAFSPTKEEVAHARRVVAAFEAAGGAGVTSLDGRMIDRPHLIQAQRVLSLAERLGLS